MSLLHKQTGYYEGGVGEWDGGQVTPASKLSNAQQWHLPPSEENQRGGGAMVRERAGLAFGGVTDYSRTTRHVCFNAGASGPWHDIWWWSFQAPDRSLFSLFFSGGGRILLAGAPHGGYGCLGSKRDRCNVIPPMLLKYTCSSFSHCCRLGLKYAGTVQKLGWLDMQVGLLFLPFATFEKRLVRLYVLVRLKIIKNSNNKE